jgi:hypothetical protein
MPAVVVRRAVTSLSRPDTVEDARSNIQRQKAKEQGRLSHVVSMIALDTRHGGP